MKFEIGEIAVYQNITNRPEWNGIECEVIRPLGKYPDHEDPNEEVYIVRDERGVFSAYPHQLKKKPPEASWEEIQKSIGWSPVKDKAVVV